MYATVLERFPEWSERIRQLWQTDAVFAEVCADYEELSNWLASHSPGEGTTEAAYRDNRQLLAELEEEIREMLQETDRQSDSSG